MHFHYQAASQKILFQRENGRTKCLERCIDLVLIGETAASGESLWLARTTISKAQFGLGMEALKILIIHSLTMKR